MADKISMDGQYATREGFSVRILCVDAPGDEPVIGLLNDGSIENWSIDGRYCTAPSMKDLIEIVPPPESKLLIAAQKVVAVSQSCILTDSARAAIIELETVINEQ